LVHLFPPYNQDTAHKSQRNNVLISILWFCWSLLAISILTTKQHFIWDLFTAIIITLWSWKYWFLPILNRSNDEKVIKQFEDLVID